MQSGLTNTVETVIFSISTGFSVKQRMFQRIFMNKAMLIDAIADITGFSKTECREVFEAAVATIENTLKKGGEVAIAGFGTFVTVDRKPRKGVNPATGKPMSIPAKRVPK